MSEAEGFTVEERDRLAELSLRNDELLLKVGRLQNRVVELVAENDALRAAHAGIIRKYGAINREKGAIKAYALAVYAWRGAASISRSALKKCYGRLER